jgi:hypothetical protein
MTEEPLDVLLVCDRLAVVAETVHDHIKSFRRYSAHRIWELPIMGDLPRALDLNRFDAIVLHYTLVISNDAHLSVKSRDSLRHCNAVKALFIQDEYRFVDRSIEAMKDLGIDLLFTCVPQQEVEKVYSDRKLPNVRKVSVLTGYVPERLLTVPVTPLTERPIDIGYRGRDVPAWLGRLGQDKIGIARKVVEDAPKADLKVDISTLEGDRIYGRKWIKFLQRCKAVLGVESGASVFDFTGQIQRVVEAHQHRDPSVDFETLRRLYFADLEGQIDLAQISPRHFEAAALGTLMILYEGKYSGILEPWRHYVPLKKDHSNFAEVVAILRNHQHATEIVRCARNEIAFDPRYSYRHAVGEFDAHIAAVAAEGRRPVGRPYAAFEFARISRFDLRTHCRRLRNDFHSHVVRAIFNSSVRRLTAGREQVVWMWVRAVFRLVRFKWPFPSA